MSVSADTELDAGYTGSGVARTFHFSSTARTRPRLPDDFRDDKGEEEDDEDSDGEEWIRSLVLVA